MYSSSSAAEAVGAGANRRLHKDHPNCGSGGKRMKKEKKKKY